MQQLNRVVNSSSGCLLKKKNKKKNKLARLDISIMSRCD